MVLEIAGGMRRGRSTIVPIAQVREEYLRRYPGATRAEFDRLVAQAASDRVLALSRADLPELLPAQYRGQGVRLGVDQRDYVILR